MLPRQQRQTRKDAIDLLARWMVINMRICNLSSIETPSVESGNRSKRISSNIIDQSILVFPRKETATSFSFVGGGRLSSGVAYSREMGVEGFSEVLSREVAPSHQVQL